MLKINSPSGLQKFMLSYRNTLKQAWKISWKNKILWFFGFFASLVSFSAELKVASKIISPGPSIKELTNFKMFLDTGIFSKSAWINFFELLKTEPKTLWLLILVVLIIIGFAVFFAWLSTVSQISLINSTKDIIKEKKGKITIKKAIKNSNKRFWPVFWLNLIITIIINLVFLVSSFFFLFIIIKNKIAYTLVYGLIFIIFTLLCLLLSFIAKYSIAYVVLEKKKFGPAIKSAWKLFSDNWLISLEMALILFLINFVAILLISLASIALIFVFIALALSTTLVSAPFFFFVFFAIIGALAVIIFNILSGSLLNTFQTSAWTGLFLNIKDKKQKAKLERVFN